MFSSPWPVHRRRVMYVGIEKTSAEHYMEDLGGRLHAPFRRTRSGSHLNSNAPCRWHSPARARGAAAERDHKATAPFTRVTSMRVPATQVRVAPQQHAPGRV